MTEISPAAIKLWRRLQAILDEGSEETWEEDGGRRREYLDGCVRLHTKMLGLSPYECEAIDAADPEPPQWMTDAGQRADYMRAHRLYRALEAAAC